MNFDCLRSARYLYLLHFALMKSQIQNRVHVNAHYKVDGEQGKSASSFFLSLLLLRALKRLLCVPSSVTQSLWSLKSKERV